MSEGDSGTIWSRVVGPRTRRPSRRGDIRRSRSGWSPDVLRHDQGLRGVIGSRGWLDRDRHPDVRDRSRDSALDRSRSGRSWGERCVSGEVDGAGRFVRLDSAHPYGAVGGSGVTYTVCGTVADYQPPTDGRAGLLILHERGRETIVPAGTSLPLAAGANPGDRCFSGGLSAAGDAIITGIAPVIGPGGSPRPTIAALPSTSSREVGASQQLIGMAEALIVASVLLPALRFSTPLGARTRARIRVRGQHSEQPRIRRCRRRDSKEKSMPFTRTILNMLGTGLTATALTLSASLTDSMTADAAACTPSVGPGIPPPASVPSGMPGFHAAWNGQSGYPTLCPGETSTATVAYYNSGSRGWVSGRMGEMAFLGTWEPEPGQDRPSIIGGDGTLGSPATNWPRYNRVAAQPAGYVGPNQVSWFQFQIQAPTTPGTYSLYIRPLIEGATWMEDFGVYWQVTVLPGA